MKNQDRDNSSGTQTIYRSVALLRLLAANNRLGMRLVDVYQAADLQRPTAHRILQGLVAEGLVRQDQKSKRYYLGSLLYEIGLAAAPQSAIRDISHPHIEAVADQTGDTSFLVVRSGFDGVCVDRVEGAYPVKAFILEVGRRRPLNIGASGTAILSAMPEHEVMSITHVNQSRLTEQYPEFDAGEFREAITFARHSGYALSDVMGASGVRAIAVPIRNAQNYPIAAISISAVLSRLEGERLNMVASYLKAAVREIEDHMRGSDQSFGSNRLS